VLAASHAASAAESTAFWVLAIVAVAAALGMILARRAVHCAVLLAIVMLSLAVLYALQGAPFLAFVQVIVYTGAVLMLFLFVLMIVGVSAADSLVETIKGQRLAAGFVGIGMLVLLGLVVGHAALGPNAAASASFGAANMGGIAALIFTRYVFPFEVTSALLITAALGAMVLAHRERTSPKPTQRALARARMAGSHPTPLPGPGTYARHNAVDMPALLPDGSPAGLSVSPVIAARRTELGQGAIQGPAGQGVSQPAGQGASQPAGQGASQPAGQGASQPAGQGASQPAGQGASQPAGQGAIQGAAQGTIQGAAQAVRQGASQGEGPDTGQSSTGQEDARS
jgi:NADH-quinone oxidoreductase subunit J